MKKTIMFLLILIIAAGICTQSYADEITGAVEGIFNGSSATVTDMKGIGGKVLGIVQVVGYAVSLITLSILGIKYMFSATAEKAKIKEQMVPYVIGCVLLFGVSVIISIVGQFAGTI